MDTSASVVQRRETHEREVMGLNPICRKDAKNSKIWATDRSWQGWPPAKKFSFFRFSLDFIVSIFEHSAKTRLKICRVVFAECGTRQRLYPVYLGLCRVPQTLGKA